jgi:hypothetical protein
MSYTALNQPEGNNGQGWDSQGPIKFSNTIPPESPGKQEMTNTVYEGYRPSDESDPVQGQPPKKKQNTWSEKQTSWPSYRPLTPSRQSVLDKFSLDFWVLADKTIRAQTQREAHSQCSHRYRDSSVF